jgi:hypothetical protein
VPASDVRLAGSDLDQDGRADLLLWDPAADAVRWLTNFGPGDLDLAAASATWTSPDDGAATVLVAGGDLDGDGRGDFVVGWASTAETATLYVVTDHAGGALADVQTTIDVAAEAVAVGDVDGDAAADLVVGGGASVRVFRGPLPAGRLDPSDAAVHWTGLHPEGNPVVDPVGRDGDAFGRSLLLADIDLDGLTDLFVGAPMEGLHETPYRPYGRVYLVPGGSL